MKSKISLSQAFKDKKFKYGGMATLLVVVVVVAILVINLLCSFITYRLDVTSNKFYSISNLTTSIINRLEDDITIYMFYETGGRMITSWKWCADMTLHLTKFPPD